MLMHYHKSSKILPKKGRNMRVTTLIQLRDAITDILKFPSKSAFPIEISYHRGIDSPNYRVTIVEVKEDVFIDSEGNKWIKEKKETD
jgi:hypothetical protein